MRELSEDRPLVGNLEDFIHQLHRKGVVLWKEQAGLRFRAPKGVLTIEERQTLSRANEEIACFLERHPESSTRDGDRSTGARQAPLSFTQLEHWYDRLRYGGRPVRHIASEFRLRGPLRIELLKESVSAVGCRHDALRTRIVLCGGKFPVQEVADKYRSELEVVSLQTVPEPLRSTEIERHVQRAILDAENYAVSPLFKPVLLEIDDEYYLLILAMDHMISDLSSLHILSSEVFSAYSQLCRGGPIDLPLVPVQFSDHAARMHAQPANVLTQIEMELESIGRIPFPETSRSAISDGRGSLGSIPFLISRDTADELRSWARSHRTTAAMAALTAYAALVLRWCKVRETVIRFMIDGRTTAELEHTVGYLAFSVYVRVILEEEGNFIDLLEMVTERYCRARDEADFGRAISRQKRPAYTRNTGINWLPAGDSTGSFNVPGAEVVPCRSPVEFSQMMLPWIGESDREAEPGVSFYEHNGAIVGRVGYPVDRFSKASMERFADNITGFLETMMRAPARRVTDVEVK